MQIVICWDHVGATVHINTLYHVGLFNNMLIIGHGFKIIISPRKPCWRPANVPRIGSMIWCTYFTGQHIYGEEGSGEPWPSWLFVGPPSPSPSGVCNNFLLTSTSLLAVFTDRHHWSHVPLSAMERRWMTVGYPSGVDGGFWIVGFETTIYGWRDRIISHLVS